MRVIVGSVEIQDETLCVCGEGKFFPEEPGTFFDPAAFGRVAVQVGIFDDSRVFEKPVNLPQIPDGEPFRRGKIRKRRILRIA